VGISKTKAVALGTAQTLTAALAVIGSPGTFDVRNNGSVTLELTYNKGTDTSCTLVVEGCLDPTATSPVWLPAEPAADVSGSLSGGVFTTPQGYRRRSFDTSGTYPVHVDCGAFHRLRVKALATAGGTPDGTLAVRCAGVQES
jgi:hypothetical protein